MSRCLLFALALVAGLIGCAERPPVVEASGLGPALGPPAEVVPGPPASPTGEASVVARPDTSELAPLERHTVEVDGHPVALWSRRPSAPRGVILLVHGRTWSSIPDFDLQVPGEERSLMAALARAGWAAYAVDLRGYGATPRDQTGWLEPARAANDVIAVLRWIQAREPDEERFALLGWSLGSMVSQLAAQRAPELVSTLVLYAYPRHPDHPRSPEAPEGPPPRVETTEADARSDFVTPTISEAAAQAFVDACLEHDPVRVDWTHTEQWNELAPEKVAVPTLVIHGEHDPIALASSQAALFERLGHPDRAWVIIPRGDHAVHIEDTHEEFLSALLAFIERPRPLSR